MKYIFIVSRNSRLNYLDSRTYISWKQAQSKVIKTLAKIEELFLILQYPVFDNHLTATVTISSKKDRKYDDVSLIDH